MLDLPGFGSTHPLATRPDINAIGLAAAGWLRARAADRPVVIAGHSTASQAALTAALDPRPCAAATPCSWRARRSPRSSAASPVSCCGPRSPTATTARKLHAAEVGRGNVGILAILRSGMRDAPDERIVGLEAPVTLTSGRHDAFAPADWLDTLARSATSAASTRTSRVGGSHNNLYTHPDDLADLSVLAAADAVAWR